MFFKRGRMLWNDGLRVGSGRPYGKIVGADKESSERDLLQMYRASARKHDTMTVCGKAVRNTTRAARDENM